MISKNNKVEDLQELRNEIDGIDKKLVRLFEMRMRVAEKIAEVKKKNENNILDESRERQVIQRAVDILQDKRLTDYTVEFIKNNMKLSKDFQKEVIEQSKVR